MLKKTLPAIFSLLLVAMLVSACTTDDGLPGSSSGPTPMSGTVQGIQSQTAAVPTGLLSRLAAIFLGNSAQADITGLAPLAGITVELVRLDGAGNIIEEGLAFDVTDADGVFNFPDPPPPVDSSLMIRTVDTLDEMRALVGGSVVNITPVTEFTTREVIGTLDETIVLGNFLPQEIAALHALLVAMDVDLTGMGLEDAVDELSGAVGTLFADMLAAYSAPGAELVLRSNNFSMTEYSTRLRDPAVLGAEQGGIDLGAGQGNMSFTGNSDAPGIGQMFLGHFLHDLGSVRDLALELDEENGFFGVDLSDLLHVVAPDYRLIIADRSEPARAVAGIGALAPNGSLLVYPMEVTTRNGGDLLAASGKGLRIAARWEPNVTPPLDNSLLDPAGTGTDYHLVRLTQHLAAGEAPGENRITLTTTTGSLGFDSSNTDPSVFDDENGDGRVYGDFVSSGLAHNALSLDLADYSVSSPTDTSLFDGLYYVVPNSGVLQLRDSAGIMLGTGLYSEDGGFIAVPTFTGGFEEEMTEAGRSLLVAVRKASEAPAVAGVYNVVGHTLSLAGGSNGLVESAYRYGTVELDANNVAGGELFGKRSGLDLVAAQAEELSLITESGIETVTGGNYLVSVDGAISLTLDIDIDGQPVSVTGAGAVSGDGSLIVVATESDDGAGNGRGLLFLLRQPGQSD